MAKKNVCVSMPIGTVTDELDEAAPLEPREYALLEVDFDIPKITNRLMM